MLWIRVVYPGSRIRIFPSQIRIKEFKYFSTKKVSKLSEIGSGLFIPDLEPRSEYGFFTHPGSRIQVSKRHRILDPRSGSAALYVNKGDIRQSPFCQKKSLPSADHKMFMLPFKYTHKCQILHTVKQPIAISGFC